MDIVADTSFFIHQANFTTFDKIYTVAKVIDEIKDKVSKIRMSGLNIIVRKPSQEYLKQITKISDELGENLSETDKEVLALALELKKPIATDDFGIQNVAKKLGIKIVPIRFEIKKTRKIVYICPNCKKTYKTDGYCPDCGVKLRKIHYYD